MPVGTPLRPHAQLVVDAAPTPAETAASIVRLIPLGTHLVGVEGFMGAGKTTIAKAIASALAAPLISTDEFVSPREPGQMRRAYPDHVRQDDLGRRLITA